VDQLQNTKIKSKTENKLQDKNANKWEAYLVGSGGQSQHWFEGASLVQ
jgi:hypothetical protein